MNLTGVTVKKIKANVKEGSGKYGPWKLHIVWLDDPDWGEVEFSFFEDKNTKVLPEEGKSYAVVEIEERDQGYRIKKFTPVEEKPKPKAEKAKPRRQGGGYQRPVEKVENPISMYFSYGKDIAVALIAKDKKPEDMEAWIKVAAKGGKCLYDAAEKAAPTEALQKEADKKAEPKEPVADNKPVNVAPLIKLMVNNVIDMSEEVAKNILPKTVNAQRFNVISEHLKAFQGKTKKMEMDDFVRILGDVVKQNPIEGESNGKEDGSGDSGK